MKAFGDYIIIKQDSNEKVLSSGIIIPDTANEKPNTGTVLSVGSGVEDHLEEGDRIVYKEGMAYDLEVDKEQVLAILKHNVIAAF